MKRLFVLAMPLISFMFFSCGTTGNNNEECEIVKLTEETLPPISKLKLEKVELNEDYLMGHSSCFIYKDTVLLVLKDGDPYPLTHMLTIINLNTNKKIGEYFTRGQGPGELISVLARMSNNYLDMCCYTTGKLIPFNIDSAILCGNGYKPNIFDLKGKWEPEWGSVNDTLFLTTNKYYFDECKECELNSTLPEFYKINKNGEYYPEYKTEEYKKIKYRTSNVAGSTISINKNKKTVVCCYRHKPYIKVFDFGMNIKRIIIGPEPDDGEYLPLGNAVFFSPEYGVNDFYYSANCDDENIFVINYRTHKCKLEDDEYSHFRNSNREIFRLDWLGNVIARYGVDEMEIIHENYCKSSNTLYLWVNEDGEGCMYKAKLD